MVPSPGHSKGCDGGMEAMKAGCEMRPVHWGGQDLWPFVHREEIWGQADPCGHGAELQRVPQVLGFVLDVQRWFSVLEVLGAGWTW